MFDFKILKKSKISLARIGIISTPHGDIETPSFVPVATRATVRTLESAEVLSAGSQILICNTYHLHVAPGESTIKKMGGLHKFMNWNSPLMTDSGGFQVFSLGFGTDHGVGKILKERTEKTIIAGTQPRSVKITDDGVHFPSPVDGTRLFIGPRESIRIQESLGADIIFSFDECPSPLADEKYMRISVDRTHRWARICLDVRKNKKQALYGIVQGGPFPNLRLESSRIIGALPFDGFGIGGEFGYDKRSLQKMLSQVHMVLPPEKPRHVLGVGHPEDFPYLASAGADTFDCIAPTHYARRGVVFTSKGRLDLRKPQFVRDFKSLDPSCKCDICTTYTRSYISSLLRAHELTGMKLATFHNLFYFNALAAHMRRKIKNGDL